LWAAGVALQQDWAGAEQQEDCFLAKGQVLQLLSVRLVAMRARVMSAFMMMCGVGEL